MNNLPPRSLRRHLLLLHLKLLALLMLHIILLAMQRDKSRIPRLHHSLLKMLSPLPPPRMYGKLSQLLFLPPLALQRKEIAHGLLFVTRCRTRGKETHVKS
eukprot:Rmarinus@m.13791